MGLTGAFGQGFDSEGEGGPSGRVEEVEKMSGGKGGRRGAGR